MIVLELKEQELMQMKAAVMDKEGDEALHLLKAFIQRLEKKKHTGMKSHLDQ
ncbi:MAG: hypothetical protein GWP07_04185 [Xanthomonadaceae bacterium]|nr:hypothetical protein [Xanthomonadaceae bacterium]